jgi:dienelactone hydrolase
MIRMALALAAGTALAGAASAADVDYEANGDPMRGYFAKADDPKGLVLIVHDWDGLDDYERRRADMLAEAGYDAFAIDVYGAENRPESQEERTAATRAAFADPERLSALVAGGVEAARAQSGAGAMVMTGYCFGGTVTLATARSGGAEGIEGYATFHGNFPEGPEWSAETPPLLVMHGGADEGPSMTDVAAFVQEVEGAALDYRLEVYSGAPHAFTVFGSERYREDADLASWATFMRFLDERLASTEG